MSTTLVKHMKQMGLVQAHVFKSNNPKAHRYFNYSSPEDYILDRGEAMTSDVGLTDGELEIVLSAASFSSLTFKPKQCYHNAMMLAVHDRSGKIAYCEGYALTGAIPTAHAWNTINGKVVDLTRSLREEAVDEFMEGKPPQKDLMDRVLGKVPEGWEYVGVPFSTADVISYVQVREATGSIIADWEGGYPLFTRERLGNSEPFDGEEWGRLTGISEEEDNG